MKKRYILAIVLSAMFLSFTVSCSKSEESTPTNPETPDNPINHDDPFGVYNPGKKIRRVYYKSPYSDRKELEQLWQWNGDLLESIKYYGYNENLDYVEQFIYDGQRLSRIEYSDGDFRGYVEFRYENNELKSAECYGPYDYSELQCKIKFVYQEKKVSKITYQSEFTDLSLQFTWNQDNVSMISITGNDEYNNAVELYYDQNNNPYKGFIYYRMCLQYMFDDGWKFIKDRSSFSSNNVTQAVFSNPIRNEVYNFIYQYDEDGFPTEQQYYNNHSEYGGTYYYEYE